MRDRAMKVKKAVVISSMVLSTAIFLAMGVAIMLLFTYEVIWLALNWEMLAQRAAQGYDDAAGFGVILVGGIAILYIGMSVPIIFEMRSFYREMTRSDG